ncbi:MAG: 23S rRNA (uracil(1939)-C(5))-methyltransferase, partial [Thiohalorhabdaceae bacterium]
ETQPKGPETAGPLDPDRPANLFYELPDFDTTLHFRSTDFVQVNREVNRKLVARAVDQLDPQPGEGILDLFCGIGNFSLPLARKGALVERAGANAAANGLAEVTDFATADLEDAWLTEFPVATECDKALLDPPRSGAVEAVKQLAETLRPGRIVYVSCNPATLARD